MSLILASQSPRRKELLGYITEDFTVTVSDADESISEKMSPSELVMHLAALKGEAVAALCPDDTVISADTLVIDGESVLGKPHGREDAFGMLKSLSGKTHSVYTGVCIITKDKKIRFYEKTDVTFDSLSDDEINRYIDSGEPFDKAGAYGIQGKGSVLVTSICGDYYNVMGLPVSRLRRVLSENGLL